MAKKSNKQFKGMLSSHTKGGGKRKAPRATVEEMAVIERSDHASKRKSPIWTEYTVSLRSIQGGAPGLRSQVKRKP